MKKVIVGGIPWYAIARYTGDSIWYIYAYDMAVTEAHLRKLLFDIAIKTKPLRVSQALIDDELYLIMPEDCYLEFINAISNEIMPEE